METKTDHNKLLKKIAKERLKTYGIIQSGNSRIFLLDKGWFVVVIEFQPSSFSKGTYLNINIDFNFYPRDYFAYSYGSRLSGFEEFETEEQFGNLIDGLCDITIKRVQELEQKFKDVPTALKMMKRQEGDRTWYQYELGFLYMLAGNQTKALTFFRKVSKTKCAYDTDWERKKITDQVIGWIQEKPTNWDKIENLVTETRQLKKLPVRQDLNVRKLSPDPNAGKGWSAWWQKLFRTG